MIKVNVPKSVLLLPKYQSENGNRFKIRLDPIEFTTRRNNNLRFFIIISYKL